MALSDDGNFHMQYCFLIWRESMKYQVLSPVIIFQRKSISLFAMLMRSPLILMQL